MRYFEKVALKTTVDDVEVGIERLVPDEYEDIIRQRADENYNKSFALRHPVLTGIPTLGIWPLIAKSKSDYDVTRHFLKKVPQIYEDVLSYQRDLSKAKAVNEDMARAINNASTNYVVSKALTR